MLYRCIVFLLATWCEKSSEKNFEWTRVLWVDHGLSQRVLANLVRPERLQNMRLLDIAQAHLATLQALLLDRCYGCHI